MSICSSLLLASAFFGSTAEARRLDITSVQASSEYTESGEDDVSYAAKNLIDHKASTVWVEGEDGSGLGSTLTLELGDEHEITALRLWNGNWYTYDFWSRHNRAKEVEVTFSDGTKFDFTLADEMVAETVRLPKKVKASSVRIKIVSVHRGSTFNDTCLSEVQVLDDAPEDFLAPSAAKASSVYPADNDGNYEPPNMWDGLLDSMWCEADKKKGDAKGVGEWVELSFDSPKKTSKVRVRNGNAYSFKLNMKANRVRRATLSFSDGSTRKVEMKPLMSEQIIEFQPATTTSIRLTIDEVARGSEFNDTCLSELQFLE